MGSAQQPSRKYDLLLRGGHVIDPRNRSTPSATWRIRGGKIAAVAEKINPADALKTVDVGGLYVTPGSWTSTCTSSPALASDGRMPAITASIRTASPSGRASRPWPTPVAPAGATSRTSRRRVIDRSRTRVFAFLNIVGHGMRGSRYEQDVKDMDPKPAAEMALKHKGLIIGIKTAHFMGRDFTAVDRAVEAGTMADIPVMVDFGRACADQVPRRRS